MGNQSDTRGNMGSGNMGSQNREDDMSSQKSQWNEKQSGKPQQSGSGQSSGTQNPGKGSEAGQQGGQMGHEHTNAGNTGFSSDQISPKTQNQQVPSRTSGSGSEQNR